MMFADKPKIGKSKKRIKSPFEFDASQADQRAGPSMGAGTYWGRAMKNPMGKLRDWSAPGQNPLNKKMLSKPPKSVV